jgi:hypothetical protein
LPTDACAHSECAAGHQRRGGSGYLLDDERAAAGALQVQVMVTRNVVVRPEAHAWLQVLDTKDCGLNDAACWCVLRGIVRHDRIQSIDLRGNYPGKSHFKAMLMASRHRAGTRFAVAFLHLLGKNYPLQSFLGRFLLEPDWLSSVGRQTHPRTSSDGYVRPSLPIDCDLLRMTMILPPDDANYDL